MNFSGWVAIPRSVISHTHTGQLSNTEQLVLLTLMLLADAKTGSGHINAAAIRAYLPELKYDTAKRVLKSLEDKRLIYRKIRHASNDLYPYWIHGYQISDGPHKLLWTNLSQVFVTRDVSAITYDDAAPAIPPADAPAIPPADAPAIPPADAPAIPPAGAPNNNNDHDKDIDKDLPLYTEGCDYRVSNLVSANVTNSVSHFVSGGDFDVSTNVSENVSAGDAWHLPSGFELRDDGGVYSSSGVRVAPNIVADMLEKGANHDPAGKV